MLLPLLLACNGGVVTGFGPVNAGIFAPFTDADGNTGAYAQAQAVEPGCVDGFDAPAGEAEPVAEQLCAIVGQVLQESGGSEISASNSVYRQWSAWFDPRSGELVGRAADSVKQSACTGEAEPTGEFEEVGTTATVESFEGEVVLSFTGDFGGSVRLKRCPETFLE